MPNYYDLDRGLDAEINHIIRDNKIVKNKIGKLFLRVIKKLEELEKRIKDLEAANREHF